MILRIHLLICLISLFMSACMRIPRSGGAFLKTIKKEQLLTSAHCGVAVWNTQKQEYLIQYNSNKHFIPASNVKIATLHAALQFLPDSLPSFDYDNTTDTLFILPKGDPSFFNPDFTHQPAVDFLKKESKPIVIVPVQWETEIYGKGWAWDDYHSSYMPEKSPIPVYTKRKEAYQPGAQIIFPSMQDKYENAAHFLSDTLGRTVTISNSNRKFNENVQTFYSASRDSVCKKMMFESDNFIAEQLLLMISNTLTGSMNENKLMGKILSDSIYAFPQKPIWVDGSGLSRYNLFSPEDLVYLLRKIEKDFGKKKIDAIFPTGNEGTLKGTYDDKAEYIYAKTGTLSGQITLSGYLTTKKNTPLIFSVMVNNHTGKSSEVKKVMARLIDKIWQTY